MAAVLASASFAAIATLSSAAPVGPRSNFRCPPSDQQKGEFTVYPDDNDHHAYFLCGDEVSERRSCSPGTVFSTKMHDCIPREDLISIPIKQFQCPDNWKTLGHTLYADKANRHVFYSCTENGPTRYQCPQNRFFVADRQACL